MCAIWNGWVYWIIIYIVYPELYYQTNQLLQTEKYQEYERSHLRIKYKRNLKFNTSQWILTSLHAQKIKIQPFLYDSLYLNGKKTQNNFKYVRIYSTIIKLMNNFPQPEEIPIFDLHMKYRHIFKIEYMNEFWYFPSNVHEVSFIATYNIVHKKSIIFIRTFEHLYI